MQRDSTAASATLPAAWTRHASPAHKGSQSLNGGAVLELHGYLDAGRPEARCMEANPVDLGDYPAQRPVTLGVLLLGYPAVCP